MKNPDNSDGLGWYCSELVWAAYLSGSNGLVNLDMDAFAVSPDEIANSGWIQTVVGEHMETGPPETVYQGGGILFGQALCPVDIVITDPNGLVLSKEQNQIPNSVYEEIDVDEDGDLDDFFVILNAEPGQYLIQVIPEPNALPEDTYSLEVLYGEKFLVLAEHVPVHDIPTEPYLVVIEGQPEPNEDGKIDITEQFTVSGSDIFDLSYKAIMFSPVADGTSYRACIRNIERLPTDPTGGQAISLSDDDYIYISLSGHRKISICGSRFAGFYVGSNGYVTFYEGDKDYSESLADHFDTLRVSCLFNDFDPSSSGTVSIKQLTDRVVVTWEQIYQFGSGGYSTFQIEMYFDGRIQLAWMEVSVPDGIVGLSDGQGMPNSFEETDLSVITQCEW
jgi:hypothetical protein